MNTLYKMLHHVQSKKITLTECMKYESNTNKRMAGKLR